MAAAVEVVELRFRDRIVDVDGGNKEAILLMHFVKTMDAGGRLLGNAAPILHDLMPAVWILALNVEEQIFDHLFFLARGFDLCPIATFLEFVTFVDEQRRVAAIIDHELWTLAVRMRDRLVSAPPVFLEAFAFPPEASETGFRGRCRGVLLRGEDAAACHAKLG